MQRTVNIWWRLKWKILNTGYYLGRCHRRQYSADWPAWRWPPLLYTIESMRVAAIVPRSMVVYSIFLLTTFKKPATSYLKKKKQK